MGREGSWRTMGRKDIERVDNCEERVRKSVSQSVSQSVNE